VAIVYATFKTLNIKQMTVSDGALREGLIYDLLGRIYDHDIRSQTSQTIAARYHTDTRHAEQIKETIRYMVDQLGEQLCFNDNPASLHYLEWAAELHEIGFEIAHSQYHKHSAYIIENADLAGFSKQDQMILSRVVRSHRKKFSLSRFDDLPAPWRRFAPIMCIVFRLATVLHRNRHSSRPDFQISIEGNDIELSFAEHWLEQAPLTQADLKQEANYLKEARFNLSF
jgi:exopolyphosphatase/guanosine-5'-triphosphate,3'-diphosphate pyrophosphatase